jgi:two-component system CheB/CheR fusion protein
VIIDVMPLRELGDRKDCLLVLFREPSSEAGSARQERQTRSGETPKEPRLAELERELLVTKEYLQLTVQELEAANEELQSSNEELQSSNEELQSSNEELETSKEELQSTNEELATINDELQSRMNQLGVSNDALQNVLAAVSVPSRRPGEPAELHEFVGKVLSTLPHVLMLLDEQLRIAWVNKAFFETFVVGAEVLGRVLDDVWPARTTHPELWNALEETVSGGKPFQHITVTHPFGRKSESAMSLSARCMPAEGERPALTLVEMEDLPT